MKYSCFFILCLFYSITAQGQNHEWAESFISTSNALVLGIDIDEQDNIYTVGTYADSLIVKNQTLKPIKPTSARGASFFCKLNNNGDVQWMRSIEGFRTNSMRISSVKVVSSNKIVVYGNFLGGNRSIVYFSNNDSIIVPQTLNGLPALLVATYDSSGNMLNYQLVNKQRGFFIGIWGIGSNGSGYVESDKQGGIYITFLLKRTSALNYLYAARDSVLLPSPKTIGNAQIFIAKYNASFDSILWVKELADAHFQTTYSIAKI